MGAIVVIIWGILLLLYALLSISLATPPKILVAWKTDKVLDWMPRLVRTEYSTAGPYACKCYSAGVPIKNQESYIPMWLYDSKDEGQIMLVKKIRNLTDIELIEHKGFIIKESDRYFYKKELHDHSNLYGVVIFISAEMFKLYKD